MAARCTVIGAAVVVISAVVSAQKALKVRTDSAEEDTTEYIYLGFCDPVYESQNGTLQYHYRDTCSDTNTFERKYYKPSDATCVDIPYTGSQTFGSMTVDLTPVSVTGLPKSGRAVFAGVDALVPARLAQTPLQRNSADVEYSCVEADSDELDLKTETYITYRDEGCPESGTICNFARVTTNYCRPNVDKNLGSWHSSSKIKGKDGYTWEGDSTCTGSASSEIERTESFLESCVSSYSDGTFFELFGKGHAISRCADSSWGFTKTTIDMILDADGNEQQSSGAGATFGLAPLAVVAVAQLFGVDMPTLRGVAVTLAIVAFAGPTTADRVPHYRVESSTAGQDYRFVSRVCTPHFRGPTDTELSAQKYGVITGYEWWYCDGANTAVKELFAHNDPECSDAQVVHSINFENDSPTYDKTTGGVYKQYCYKGNAACKTVPAEANQACADYVSSLTWQWDSKLDIDDKCSESACLSWTDLSEDSCSTNDNKCVDQGGGLYIDQYCNVNEAIDTSLSCNEAPEGMGYLKVTAYADKDCTQPCDFQLEVTGSCIQERSRSYKNTVTGGSISREWYTNSIVCDGTADLDGKTSTEIGRCLSHQEFGDTSAFGQKCKTGYGIGGSVASATGDTDVGEMSFKVEYVEGGKGASAAAGLQLYSISTVVAAAVVAARLF